MYVWPHATRVVFLLARPRPDLGTEVGDLLPKGLHGQLPQIEVDFTAPANAALHIKELPVANTGSLCDEVAAFLAGHHVVDHTLESCLVICRCTDDVHALLPVLQVRFRTRLHVRVNK